MLRVWIEFLCVFEAPFKINQDSDSSLTIKKKSTRDPSLSTEYDCNSEILFRYWSS